MRDKVSILNPFSFSLAFSCLFHFIYYFTVNDIF
jgi:hypothetical protein